MNPEASRGSGVPPPHGHDRSGHRDTRRLRWVLVLLVAYMIAEVVGGLVSGSLALLADAGHMLSDAASIGLALFAAWIARRPPSATRTYGYYRTEILAALANGVLLVLVTLYVFFEAYRRLREPPEVAGGLMLGVAVGGLAVNVAGLLLLRTDRERSLNVRGAWLHLVADAAGSVGAIAAGALIWWRGWTLADPVASVLIGVLVLASSWRLLQEAASVLMEAAPGHIDVDAVRDTLVAVPGVDSVHDLHVWTITSGLVSMSAHVVLDGTRGPREVLEAVRGRVERDYGIAHSTIQIEPEAFEEPATPV